MKTVEICALGLCGNSVFLAMDHFHRPGETVAAQGLYAEPGGKGYNQAVAAARLGAKVAFLGAIGNDSDGRMCMDYLEKEGILPLPQVCPETPSAYACILTDKEGENRVTVFRGAADLLTPEFVKSQEKTIGGSEFLLLNNEYPQSCNEMAMEIAQAHGVKVVYNPAPARPVSPEFLKGCFLVTPNLSETEVLLGKKPETLADLAGSFRRVGLENAVVTLGGDGALLVTAGKAVHFDALKVQALDTTGAGDTFTAALCAMLIRGKDLDEAVQWATNASALSVSRRYVMPGLPTWEEVERNFQPVKAECV